MSCERGMYIRSIGGMVFGLTAAPYRPIRMCFIPKPIFIPADKLQIVLEP